MDRLAKRLPGKGKRFVTSLKEALTVRNLALTVRNLAWTVRNLTLTVRNLALTVLTGYVPNTCAPSRMRKAAPTPLSNPWITV